MKLGKSTTTLLSLCSCLLAEQSAAAAVPCNFNSPGGSYVVTDVYEYLDRQTVCYGGAQLVFDRAGRTATLVGRTRCTDDSPGSHTTDYELSAAVTFEKAKCAATMIFQEGEESIEMRLFFDRLGGRFKGSFVDSRGVGQILGERR